MALMNCPECKKEISSTCKSCPHCGFPVAAAKTAELSKAIKASTDKTLNKGCMGCLGVIVLLGIIGWIFGPSDSSTGDSFHLGYKVGFVDGNMAMQQGRLKAANAEKEATAWSVASGFTSDSQEQKQEWVNGYTVGWDDGYAKH